ncbi:PLDc N-terminal domain-containing protein [Amnibacterium soli]|uniref:PLDc N-terminal domain-containing protein n=1 Tax=Amnibacterium soli TaxID=1282736 RepID=UPI0031EC9D7F
MQTSQIALLLLIAVPPLLLWIGALISILRRERTPLLALWVLVTLVLPIAGPLAWFLVGRGVAVGRTP